MKRSALLTAMAAAALLGGAGSGVEAASAIGAAVSHSTTFAGYEVGKPTSHIKHVSATFVVPTITCEHRYGGVGPSVLVYSNLNPRTGAHRTSGGGIGVACENGSALYQPVFVINDKTVASGQDTLSPGDVVVVTVSVTKAATRVTVDDVTTNKSKTHSGAGKVGNEAFIGDNSINVDGVSDKLDPFTKTHVTNVVVDKAPLGSSHAKRFWWVRHGTTLVTASTLQSGENFVLTFRNSG
ncbi:MAG: G1 family glutamic endopeptidase [Mycobacteriales bacterium]